MDGMIYTAMNGAKQIMLQQATNSHNLANVSTTGFKSMLNHFNALPVYGPGEATRVVTEITKSGINFEPGRLLYTGRNLDIAVEGEGFIAVQSPDGREAYTRAGDLRLDINGFLSNGAGHMVLGNGGLIALPPFEKLNIAKDGTLSIIPVGQSAATIAAVDRIKLVNPEQVDLFRGQDGLFYTKNGDIAVPDAEVTIVSSALESSNVSPIESMVAMIALARAFETNIKLMQLSEENDQATAQMMRLSG